MSATTDAHLTAVSISIIVILKSAWGTSYHALISNQQTPARMEVLISVSQQYHPLPPSRTYPEKVVIRA